MKIALTSPNAKTLSGHAGRCPGYLIFTINSEKMVDKQHIKLTKEQVFKHLSGPLSRHTQHPLYGIDAFITQGLGEGLKQRLQQDGIKVFTTDLSDVDEAIIAFMTHFDYGEKRLT